MELILSSAGSYPRIGETPEAQRHRRAYAQHERGEISAAEWQAVEDEVAQQVVREQAATGLDIVTDGQVRWYDPISHLARHLDGVEINGLLRYFDTNFYFRQPVVSGRLRRRQPVLRREYEVARAATVHVVMLSSATRGPASGLNSVDVGIAVTKLTGGRYENIAAGQRLATLLPELGQQVAQSHARQSRQYRITFERPNGNAPLGNVTLAGRNGMRGRLSLDGLVTHSIAPEELGTAYEGLLRKKEEYLGVIVKWV